jgi:predicted porin
MMKKSLIALALVAAAPVAFAATSNVEVYGAARLSIDSASGGKGYSVNDQSSRVGIKGSEDLGGGLAAIWQWESQMNGLDATTVGTTQRNTFVGVKGAFGTALAGVHDTPYKLGGSADLFGDTSADAQKATVGIIGRNGMDTRSNNAIAYISPDYAGFHVGVAVIADEAGSTGSAHAATSAVLVYANGPLKATYGREEYKNGRVGDKFNVAYKIGDIGLGATYEKSNSALDADKDTAYLVSASYGMGPITLAAQYGNFNDKNDVANTISTNVQAGVDVKRTTIGAIYALSKRTNTYVAYNADKTSATTDVDTKTWTLGLNHSF